MGQLPILPLEIRAGLPAQVQAHLVSLESEIVVRTERLQSVEKELATLTAQFADLVARVQQNSANSSRPPSSDPPSTPPRPKHEPSGRQRGGQPGHPGHARIQLNPIELTGVIDHRPIQCPSCRTLLATDLPPHGELRRQQVWDVPVPRPEIVEHRAYRVRCPHCDLLVPAPDLPGSSFGPHVTALTSVLHGRYRLSMRETAEIMEDLFGMPMSVGTIPAVCQEASRALEPASTAIARQVTNASHVNVDETGWKQAGARRWLWTAVAANCTLFLVAAKRNAAVLPMLLGERFAGLVTSDRHAVYRQIPTERRQICLSHLQRNVVAFAERSGPVGEWGKAFNATFDEVFAAWHVFADEDRDRARLIRTVAPLQARVHSLLEQGTHDFFWQARFLCSDVSARESALWTFVTTDRVEPTNNAAERALRPAVLWRKGCFGADSDDGNFFCCPHPHRARDLPSTAAPFVEFVNRDGYRLPQRFLAPDAPRRGLNGYLFFTNFHRI